MDLKHRIYQYKHDDSKSKHETNTKIVRTGKIRQIKISIDQQYKTLL